MSDGDAKKQGIVKSEFKIKEIDPDRKIFKDRDCDICALF